MSGHKDKFVRFPTQPTDTDWLRMATLLDTEGSIKVARNKPHTKCGGKSYHYALYVQVTNSDPRIPYWCLAIFGGNMEIRIPEKSSHKNCFVWSALSRRAQAVLEGCMGFFLAKRDQAELALTLRQKVGNTKYCRGGVSPEREIQRASIWKQLSALKHRNFTPQEAEQMSRTIQ